MRGGGSKPRLGKAGRPRASARNLCEEFAPRNGAARVCEEGGANCALKKPAGPGPAARNLCEEFAPRDGAARVREEGGANRALKKPAAGPLISKHPAAGPTLLTGGPASMPGGPIPPPGGPIPLSADPPRPSPGPALLPSGPESTPKNTGRQPGVYSYPINPIILAIPADSGRFPRILPGTLSAAEALLRCPLRGWLPRSAEVPDRAGTSAGGTNRCGRSDRN